MNYRSLIWVWMRRKLGWIYREQVSKNLTFNIQRTIDKRDDDNNVDGIWSVTYHESSGNFLPIMPAYLWNLCDLTSSLSLFFLSSWIVPLFFRYAFDNHPFHKYKWTISLSSLWINAWMQALKFNFHVIW